MCDDIDDVNRDEKKIKKGKMSKRRKKGGNREKTPTNVADSKKHVTDLSVRGYPPIVLLLQSVHNNNNNNKNNVDKVPYSPSTIVC